MSTSLITFGHVRAFQAVTTQLYGEVTLASCRINGEPGVAIVLVEHVGEGKSSSCPCSSPSCRTWISASKVSSAAGKVRAAVRARLQCREGHGPSVV